MRINHLFGYCILFLLPLMGFSQQQELMKINQKPVYKDEFLHVFNKNSSNTTSEKTQDIDDYIRLFVDFKLKVEEAKTLGLDTLPTFKKQYRNYKHEVTEKYMTDTKVNKKLLKEAYQRQQQIINAGHILIRLSKNASPKDTLAAYQKALNIKKQLDDGASFQKIAIRYSDDPSVKQTKGNLGWFGVFKMVYPFESAAYHTKVGSVSDPVRSKFGYHLIKVYDKRPAMGKIELAQIYIKEQTDSAKTKTQIDKIYRDLKSGADFGQMAQQYSDDKKSAKKGGELNPLKPTDIRNRKIQEVIFGLSEKQPLSEPFKTEDGWRILKYIEKLPVKSFEDEEDYLEKMIKRSGRNAVIKDSIIQRLKRKYTVKVENPGLSFFENKSNKILINLENKDLPKTPLLKIKDDSVSYAEFLKQIKSYLRFKKDKITNEVLADLFSDFKDYELYKYQETHLADFNPKFKQQLKDYCEGVLIFNLMQDRVWNKAEDSIALHTFYKQHKVDFKSSETYEVTFFTSKSKRDIKRVRKALKKSNNLESIKDKYDDVMVNSGNFDRNDAKFPKKYNYKKGLSKILKHNGVFMLINLTEIVLSQDQKFENIKGKVMAAYQEELEKEFIDKLRQKYTVNIDKKAVKELKSELKK